MYLIIGLGNPGKEYSGSRHNLGYRVVEALSRRLKCAKPVTKHWSLYATAGYKSKQVMLAQPLTFMNLSGRAVVELINNNKIDLCRLLIIYDDLDLPPGVIRLREKGGSAGHNGLQSIIDSLGTTDFSRLRIGIGRPTDNTAGSDYVLQPIGPDQSALFETAIERAAEAALVFVEHGSEAAMNLFNRELPSPD